VVGFAPEQPLHVVALACPASGILKQLEHTYSQNVNTTKAKKAKKDILKPSCEFIAFAVKNSLLILNVPHFTKVYPNENLKQGIGKIR
jgi:hypothetical protein